MSGRPKKVLVFRERVHGPRGNVIAYGGWAVACEHCGARLTRRFPLSHVEALNVARAHCLTMRFVGGRR